MRAGIIKQLCFDSLSKDGYSPVQGACNFMWGGAKNEF